MVAPIYNQNSLARSDQPRCHDSTKKSRSDNKIIVSPASHHRAKIVIFLMLQQKKFKVKSAKLKVGDIGFLN
jgi:hypothetical protein